MILKTITIMGHIKLRLIAIVIGLNLLTIFAKAQKLYIGANWHPHDLDEKEITRDIKLMKDAGFNVVRLGHLAWDSYEPREGVYTFEWFDKVMNMCDKAGIKVILDIAVRPAPMWLHKKYPGVNIVDANGTTIYANTRYYEDVGNPDYQRCALAFTDTISRRYANHPALLGLGMDNEPSCGHISFSESVRQRFIKWLENKYHTTDMLNKAWAGQRWSRKLSEWDEVVLPTGLAISDGQPEKRLDFRRFLSDEINGFYFKMLKIMRRNAPKAQTYSNAWYYCKDKYYDYAPMAYSGMMTREGNGFYPGTSLKDDKALRNALFGMARIQYESQTPFWNVEFTSFNATPGAIRKYAYMTLMYGSQMVCGWTWQTMHGGEEQYLTGMMDWDGITNDKYDEYKRVASEFKKIEHWFPYQPKADIAIAMSFASEMSPGMLGGSHENSARDCFNECYDRNLNVKIVDLRYSDLDYKLLIVPDVSVMDSVSAMNIRAFVKRGGTVVMTGNSTVLDSTGQVFRTTLPGRLANVFGIRVSKFLQPETINEVVGKYSGNKFLLKFNGKDREITSGKFCYIHPQDAKVLGYISSLDKDYPLITENKFGKGTAIYVGLQTKGELIGELIDNLLPSLKLHTEPIVPKGVKVRKTDDNHILFFNATNDPVTISMKGKSLLYDKTYDGTFVIAPQDADFVEIKR